jgi:F0F1-type ATP synthase delta subunit
MAYVTTQELARYAIEELEAGVNSSVLASKLAAYLVEERRSRDLPAVLRVVNEELARRGSSQVIITAAHTVTEQSKNELARILGVINPVFTEVIDPSVIGGVKARSGETEIDLTVRGKLNRFKTNIVNSGN